ncbi:MAG: YkgJ family cysteine cluster protein [Luteibaculaceae bacterium]
MEYQIILDRGLTKKNQFKKLTEKVKKMKPYVADSSFELAHNEAFEQVNCMQCANCCKTTSPIFRMVDIERLSKALGMKSGLFVEKYLTLDSDGDYVLTTAPCPFLLQDNSCSVYENRPLACREYPHTNRKRIQQIMKLTLKNTDVCPAVVLVLENIQKKFV